MHSYVEKMHYLEDSFNFVSIGNVMSMLPFQNLKLIDLSTVLAGPSVGSFFAELGADVLKIENAEHPDITRSWKLPSEEKTRSVSAYFSSINYKKKYLSLNLKQENDRNKLQELVATVDIVLMNYKKGDQTKLRIEDDWLRAKNTQLVIGKINGFGTESDRVAYDLILQAETGIMSMNGTPNSGPVKMPVALIDVLAAHHLKEGLLIELLAKNTAPDYIGKTVSVSLYDAAICSLVNQASNYLMGKHVPQRIGSLHPNIAPYGEIFTTSDNKTITFAIGSDRHFRLLCSFLGKEDLAANNQFNTVQNRVANRTALAEILTPLVQQHSWQAIKAYCRAHFLPCGEIKDLAAVFTESTAKALVRSEEIDGVATQRVTGIAFRSSH